MTTELDYTIKLDKDLSKKNGHNYNPKIVTPKHEEREEKRYPRTTVPRYANIFGKSNKAKLPRLKAPYRTRELHRFEDTYRTDGVVKNAINKKWHFILGSSLTVQLDVDREYQTDEERAEALQAVMNYEPYKVAMNKANELLSKLEFRSRSYAAGVSASVYGRACIEIVRDPLTNKISRLNVLNSKLLGDVEVDKDSWELLGVHYRDLPRNDDFLSTKEIIYITRTDVHISPGSMYYGLSDLEPVIDGSETKRIIKQEDLKEISKGLWAGLIWVLFKNANVSDTDMQRVIDSIKPGAPMGTDQDVEIQVSKVAQDSPMLLEMINELNLETGRDLDVPSPLIGYENKQNYSNLVQTLISWKESTLEAERRWFTDLMEKQLLKEIFVSELRDQGVEYNEEQQEIEQVVPPNPLSPLSSVALPTINVIPPAKLTLEITDPNFQPHKERVETALSLYDAQLISARKVLEESGMEDQIEETELRLQENKMKQEQIMGFQQNVFQNQVQTNNMVQDKRMQILDKMDQQLNGEMGKSFGPKGSFNKSKGKSSFGEPNKNPIAYPKTASMNYDNTLGHWLDIPDYIQDPQIKSLYKEMLQQKKEAYKRVNNTENNTND